MEQDSVKRELDIKGEEKPIVIDPDSLLSKHYIDILTVKTEVDLKSTNCLQGGQFQDGTALQTINSAGNIKRWTVSSSVILPVKEIDNTCSVQVSDQSVDTGHRCVSRVMLADSLTNEDTDTCGAKLSELNEDEHTGQLVFIPNVTIDHSDPSTDSDVLLSPLSSNEQFDNSRSGDSEANKCSESTSITDGKGIIQNVDDTPCGDHIGQPITVGTSSQTLGNEMSESSKVNQKYQASSGEQPFKCHVYGIGISTSGALTVHHGINTGKKPYKCDVCKKEFAAFRNLSGHQCIQTEENSYKCDDCQKKFTLAENLCRHKHIHTGETPKPYMCDICGNGYRSLGALNHHIRVHTGEKPYKCDVCQKEFTGATNLRQHERIHTGEKPYKCDVCPKAFTLAVGLRQHKLMHTGEKPYKCEICQKEFRRALTLQQHKRIHTCEKPYKCDVCQKDFNRIAGLRQHMRIHTGETPYKCDICQQQFNRSNGLRLHKLRMHTSQKVCVV